MEKKQKLRKELFAKLKKDITRLERDIKFAKYEKLKVGSIRNLKIAGHVLHGIYPYVICAGIVLGGGVLSDMGLPFEAHEYKVQEKYKLEMSSENQTPITETSYDSIGGNNQIRVFRNWRQTKNGYEREVQTYSISDEKLKDLTPEEIQEIVRNKDIEQILLLFEKPKVSMQIQSNAPSSESMADNYCLVGATLMGTNKENVIMKKQTIGDVALKTFVEFAIIILISMLPITIRENSLFGSMSKNIKRTIYHSQPKNQVSDLKDSLLIKRDNYRMLGGRL